MSRSHGELFLLADRKNRMERARLDRQLKGMDKECARNEYLIQRQQRAMVTKFRTVSMTTGHSDKGLPPDGPLDNVYDKSKYTLCRLSEKRLMEWRVRERQLDKFLRRFHTRPASSPPAIRPRPSSSRSERSASRSSGPAQSAVSAAAGTSARPPPGRVRPATAAVLQRQGPQPPRRRCASAVSFSCRTQTMSLDNEEEEGEEEGGWDERGKEEVVEDDKRGGPDDNEVFQSRLRSLSMVSLPEHYARHNSRRSTLLKPGVSEATSKRAFEAFRDKGMNAPLNTAEVIEKFKTSAKNYEDFIRAHSVPETKFVVTKDSVLMTDGTQQKCKKLRASQSMSDLTDRSHKPCSSGHPGKGSKDLTSNADHMSLSSVSSDDLTDNVFIGHEDHPKIQDSGESPDTTLSPAEQKTGGDDSQQPDTIPDNQANNEDHIVSLKHNDLIEVIDDQRKASTREQFSGDLKTGSCQSVKFAKEIEDCQTKDSTLVPTEPVPMKKVNSTAKKNLHGKNHSEGLCSKHNRRHSCHPALHPGSCRSRREADHSRAHSVSGPGEMPERPSSHALLEKRHQKTLPRQHLQSTSAADSSSVTSAMTITSLLRKQSGQTEAEYMKQTVSVGVQRVSSAKPPRPSSGSVSQPKPTASAQHNRHPHNDPKTSALHQQSTDSNTDSNPTHSDHNRSLSESSTSSQQNRNVFHRFAKSALKQQHHQPEDHEDSDSTSSPEDPRQASQWRRDLELEQPVGLRSRVSSLSTVLKAAMVFSKAARKKALTTMVEENNVHTHEAIRQERLRTLQSRASVLTKIVAQFPVPGGD